MFSLIRLNHSVLGCTILLVTDHKQIRDIGDRIVRYTKPGCLLKDGIDVRAKVN
ncbi:MAG: hypothetical protein V7K50_08390 [Nostoc sp.]|uniref:hypothetical protein n=1 Tax=Nostoc sp. TaxID=1180 RepID=UPI002FF9C8E7